MPQDTDRRVVVVAHVERSVRQIARAALEARGLAVHTTSRGEEAIRLALEHAPPVVLLSLKLKHVDGWRVVEVLQERRGRESALVALTADAREETRERALAHGFTRYLTLPILPFVLADHVSDLCGPGRSGREAG